MCTKSCKRDRTAATVPSAFQLVPVYSRPARCTARPTVGQSNHSKTTWTNLDYVITSSLPLEIKIQTSNTWPWPLPHVPVRADTGMKRLSSFGFVPQSGQGSVERRAKPSETFQLDHSATTPRAITIGAATAATAITAIRATNSCYSHHFHQCHNSCYSHHSHQSHNSCYSHHNSCSDSRHSHQNHYRSLQGMI